jgi:hypothetical protein
MIANLGYPATPSYQEMGKAKPQPRKDDRPFMNHTPAPIKILLINHTPAPIKILLFNEHQIGREERRRQERMIAEKQRYDNPLGEKHRKRLKLS